MLRTFLPNDLAGNPLEPRFNITPKSLTTDFQFGKNYDDASPI